MAGAFSAKAAVVTGPPEKQARIRWMVDELCTNSSPARCARAAFPRPTSTTRSSGPSSPSPAASTMWTWARSVFLFQVAVNLASHWRRKLARRREVLDNRTPERVETIATPEHLTGRKQMRELLDDIVGGMDASLRTVFLLHEFEEMNLTRDRGASRDSARDGGVTAKAGARRSGSTCAPSVRPGSGDDNRAGHRDAGVSAPREIQSVLVCAARDGPLHAGLVGDAREDAHRPRPSRALKRAAPGREAMRISAGARTPFAAAPPSRRNFAAARPAGARAPARVARPMLSIEACDITHSPLTPPAC